MESGSAPGVVHVSPRGRLALASTTMLIIATACFDWDDSADPEWKTVTLEVEGAVVSSVPRDSIPGATVTLGVGGHFTLPNVLATTTTDAAGRYAMSASFQHSDVPNCSAWLIASASGYVDSGMEDSRHRISCTPGLHQVTIFLDPASEAAAVPGR